MLEYKGYHAKVSFDEEDALFIGEVFGINDSLNFHGRRDVHARRRYNKS